MLQEPGVPWLAPEQRADRLHILDSVQMNSSMNMTIAGVSFTVRCRHMLSAKGLAGIYDQFVNSAIPATGDIRVNIRIEIGNMPDTRQMTKIFDSEGTWSMFRRNYDYFLSLNVPTTRGQANWLVTFDRHCKTISIYGSDLLLREEEGLTTLTTPISYPIDQILLMYILAGKGGALLHAAGTSIDKKGYIFPGRSGAGKSTLSRHFLGRDRVEMLSDDRIIVRKMDGNLKAFGTPWAGDANIAENRGVMLNRIFFIQHADTNMIKELKPKEAFERLMPITSIPWYDDKAMQNIFTFCEDMVLNVPAYELHFRPDREVVTFFEDFIARSNV